MEADIVRRNMRNILQTLTLVADERYQRRAWSRTGDGESWETYGEVMASLFDDADSLKFIKLSDQELDLSTNEGSEFRGLILRLAAHSDAHRPNRDVFYEMLKGDREWSDIVLRSQAFLKRLRRRERRN